ncbi:Hypothetical predicted protein [Xyrichtys novacula]|uniref:Uncharacterized protein n=1 Tax=Xyrichtys novacula TaxID=13765 RepID=A0AAV1FV20_XYRNO|nr:Hypothetical predicted protein [Xyrichtys novacula]
MAPSKHGDDPVEMFLCRCMKKNLLCLCVSSMVYCDNDDNDDNNDEDDDGRQSAF